MSLNGSTELIFIVEKKIYTFFLLFILSVTTLIGQEQLSSLNILLFNY